jgi:S1-C subfamily serine protease
MEPEPMPVPPATSAAAMAPEQEEEQEDDEDERPRLRMGLVIGVSAAIVAGMWFAGVAPFRQSPQAAEHVTIESVVTRPAAKPLPSAGPVEIEAPRAIVDQPIAPVALTSTDATALLSTEEIVTRSLPAVVTIESSAGTGSGFFVATDTVVTNAHVVRSAQHVTLRLSGGTTTAASVVTASPQLDLAILKAHIVAHDQAVLPLGEPRDVRIGGEVVAIGSPLGLRNTVTRGIVSGMRDAKGVTLIQTDAAINPGNSGGPLIDRTGRVIGVNTLKLVGEETEAIGFAVSVNHARTLLGDEFVAPSAAAAAEQRRVEFSLKKYDEAVLTLAKRADAIEIEWRKFKPQCAASNAEAILDREWFGLADGQRHALKPLSRCQSLIGYFDDWARRVKTALAMYDSTARKAGVPPEQLRELREKYNLSWSAWQ